MWGEEVLAEVCQRCWCKRYVPQERIVDVVVMVVGGSVNIIVGGGVVIAVVAAVAV